MGISLQLTSGKPKKPKEIKALSLGLSLKFQNGFDEGGRKKKEGEENVFYQIYPRKWIENHASMHWQNFDEKEHS